MKGKNITIDDLALMMKKGFDSVDKRFDGVDKKFEHVDNKFVELRSDIKIDIINLEGYIDKKIKALDLKFSEKFNDLTTTLDKFLKRMTDIEDEFTMMRNDINRIKKTIKEKLGVELS